MTCNCCESFVPRVTFILIWMLLYLTCHTDICSSRLRPTSLWNSSLSSVSDQEGETRLDSDEPQRYQFPPPSATHTLNSIETTHTVTGTFVHDWLVKDKARTLFPVLTGSKMKNLSNVYRLKTS